MDFYKISRVNLVNMLSNSITIGLIGGLITFLYLYYNNNYSNFNEDILVSKKKKPINIVTPCAVALLTWFILSNIYDYNNFKTSQEYNIPKSAIKQINIEDIIPNEIFINQNNITKNISEISEPNIHIINKNEIKIPDIFTEPFDV
jgi:hypothetical protein